MPPAANSNETYCTFTLASDVTAGGLPSEAEIAKDLESSDDNVSILVGRIEPKGSTSCIRSFPETLLCMHVCDRPLLSIALMKFNRF
jgi:hypothetical protein